MSVSVSGLAAAVCASLVNVVTASTGVPGLEATESVALSDCCGAHGSSSHQSVEESGDLHFERWFVVVCWRRIVCLIETVGFCRRADVQKQDLLGDSRCIYTFSRPSPVLLGRASPERYIAGLWTSVNWIPREYC